MTDLSENVSEKKRGRGRPRAFSEEEERWFDKMQTGNNCLTRRGKMNHWYALEGGRALKEGSRFKWLLDTEAIMAGTAHFPHTILSEIGRIPNDDDKREVAAFLCERKPKVKEAVRIIRHFRIGKRAPASADSLSDRLCNLIDDYREGHKGASLDLVREALQVVAEAVDTAEATEC
jgi:hypothetical protein